MVILLILDELQRSIHVYNSREKLQICNEHRYACQILSVIEYMHSAEKSIFVVSELSEVNYLE